MWSFLPTPTEPNASSSTKISVGEGMRFRVKWCYRAEKAREKRPRRNKEQDGAAPHKREGAAATYRPRLQAFN
jgi:hypothetical protein